MALVIKWESFQPHHDAEGGVLYDVGHRWASEADVPEDVRRTVRPVITEAE